MNNLITGILTNLTVLSGSTTPTVPDYTGGFDAVDTVTTVLGIVQALIYIVAAGLILWGVIEVGLAQREENSSKKDKGVKNIGGGVVVLIGGVLFQTFIADLVLSLFQGI